RVEHPVIGWLPNVALPIRYSGTPVADPKPAPAVGQHTEEVLRETLGYSDERIAALRASGALSASAPAAKSPAPAQAEAAA
ncbi:MAG: CoA transferase, partial [Rubrivivax sp.]